MSSYANSGRRAIDATTFLKGKATLAEGNKERLTGTSVKEVPHDGRAGADGADPALPSASGASEPVSEQSPPLIFKDTTPSGIVVEYQSQPKRLYRVNGTEVPSVTTVLEVLSKPGLKFWGQDVGVRAILELFDRGHLSTVIDWMSNEQKLVIGTSEKYSYATFEDLKALITAEKLSCNHVLTKAGDRGTNVHAALESWARSGGEFAPTPQNFNDEERPYVEAFLSWLDACDGAARPVQCEVMVGSAEHGFAGRYDLVIELTTSSEFVVKALKKPKTVVVQPGRYLIDLKSSSGVYPTSHFRQLAAYELASIEGGYPKTDGQFVLHVSKHGTYQFVQPGRYLIDLKSSSGVYPTSHFRQLAAYELASIEGGYPKTDGQFVLHVSKHGTYQFVQSTATPDDFLAVLRTWQSDRRLTGK